MQVAPQPDRRQARIQYLEADLRRSGPRPAGSEANTRQRELVADTSRSMGRQVTRATVPGGASP